MKNAGPQASASNDNLCRYAAHHNYSLFTIHSSFAQCAQFLLLVQLEHRHESFGRHLDRTQASHFLLASPMKPRFHGDPGFHSGRGK